MHWYHEFFVLKGVLIHIPTYTWWHLLTPMDPGSGRVWGDPKVFDYSILSKISDTIEFFLKISASANILHL